MIVASLEDKTHWWVFSLKQSETQAFIERLTIRAGVQVEVGQVELLGFLNQPLHDRPRQPLPAVIGQGEDVNNSSICTIRCCWVPHHVKYL